MAIVCCTLQRRKVLRQLANGRGVLWTLLYVLCVLSPRISMTCLSYYVSAARVGCVYVQYSVQGFALVCAAVVEKRAHIMNLGVP